MCPAMRRVLLPHVNSVGLNLHIVWSDQSVLLEAYNSTNGAMTLEATYRRKCHITGWLASAVIGINGFVYALLQINIGLRNTFKFNLCHT